MIEFATKHSGVVLVLIGVIGEVYCDWKEMKGRLAKGSALLLVFGLLLEFNEAAQSDSALAVMERKTAELSYKIEIAHKEAAVAEKRSSEAKERLAQAELRITYLRRKQGQRGVTPKFDEAIRKAKASGSVDIVFAKEDGEAYFFAQSIYMSLTSAGWKVPMPMAIPLDVPAIKQFQNLPPYYLQTLSSLQRMGAQPVGVSIITNGKHGAWEATDDLLQNGFLDSVGVVRRGMDDSLPDGHFRIAIGQKE